MENDSVTAKAKWGEILKWLTYDLVEPLDVEAV